MNSWLRVIWKYQNTQVREYENKKWETKESYRLWIAIEWWKISIDTNKKQDLKESSHYSFPVWTRWFSYINEEWETQNWVSYFLRNDVIEELN